MVRLGTKVTNGPGSRAAGLAMTDKPIDAAQAYWRAGKRRTPRRARTRLRGRLPQGRTARMARRHHPRIVTRYVRLRGRLTTLDPQDLTISPAACCAVNSSAAAAAATTTARRRRRWFIGEPPSLAAPLPTPAWDDDERQPMTTDQQATAYSCVHRTVREQWQCWVSGFSLIVNGRSSIPAKPFGRLNRSGGASDRIVCSLVSAEGDLRWGLRRCRSVSRSTPTGCGRCVAGGVETVE